LPEEEMPFLPDGTPVDVILNPLGVPSRMNIGQVMEAHLGWAAHTLGFRAINPIFDGADALTIEDALARTWIAWKAGAVNFSPQNSGKPNVDLEKAEEWLARHGFDGREVMDEEHRGVARRVSLCLWLEELGIASGDLDQQQLEQVVEKVKTERNLSPPIMGKVILRDGRGGVPFDQPVTVGSIYMMKLIHLVEDKVHARSTGPYSLITQQPLGGKAQFGGQRFGEMEVWALEAYGAAHNLQEILTIKSDDVTGRAKTYEAIVKNEDILQPGVPESFRVLVKELQSLGLAIEVINEEERATAEETKEAPKLEAELEAAESPTEPEATSAEEVSEAPKLEVEPETAEDSTEPEEKVEEKNA